MIDVLEKIQTIKVEQNSYNKNIKQSNTSTNEIAIPQQ